MAIRIEDWMEAAYFSLWEDEFRKRFGRNVASYKLLRSEEALVGADWCWGTNSRKPISQADFVSALNKAIHHGKHVTPKFLGYFHQYKVVQKMADIKGLKKGKKEALEPYGYVVGQEYYRCKLATTDWDRDKVTKLTQHETLIRLSRIKKGHVRYICPMLFSVADLDPSIRSLNQLIEIRVTPSVPDYSDNCAHHLYFSDKNGNNAVWMSEPISASLGSQDDFPTDNGLQTAGQLAQYLNTIQTVLERDWDSPEIAPFDFNISDASALSLVETIDFRKLPESFRLLVVGGDETIFQGS